MLNIKLDFCRGYIIFKFKEKNINIKLMYFNFVNWNIYDKFVNK